ncbi:MAG TPA: hypothetical protein DCE44_08615 [Verrucomicrobiales bacterium]|nr:hypothetical protein [Verrucomicrobiales bacterium]
MLLSSTIAGYLAPEVAAFALVSLAIVAGFFWRYLSWPSVFIFVGGLVGLAARNSAGSPERFRSNLASIVVLAVVLVGIGVIARGVRGTNSSCGKR